MSRIFIGNVPPGSTDVELQQWVESRGFSVESAQIIYDRVTGKSRGFGFVTLCNDVNSQSAITALNGQRMNGRALTVNEATPVITASPAGYAQKQ